MVLGEDTYVRVVEPQPAPNALDPSKLWGYLPHDFELADLLGRPSYWTLKSGSVNHDDRNRQYPGTNQGAPETVVTYKKGSFVTMTPAWQSFLYSQMTYACFGFFERERIPAADRKVHENAWGSAIQGNRVMTNKFGPDHNNKDNTIFYRDTIRNLYAGNGYWKHDCLLFGGGIVRILDARPVNKGTLGACYAIETLDWSAGPPDPQDVNFMTRPDLVTIATNIAPYAAHNTWQRVDPFPQFLNWNAHTVFLNISDTGVNWVPTSRCYMSIFPMSVRPNPYSPARELSRW